MLVNSDAVVAPAARPSPARRTRPAARRTEPPDTVATTNGSVAVLTVVRLGGITVTVRAVSSLVKTGRLVSLYDQGHVVLSA
jgi:hypothetical protein